MDNTLFSYYELGFWMAQLVSQKSMKESDNIHYKGCSFDESIMLFLERVSKKLKSMNIEYSLTYEEITVSLMEKFYDIFTEPFKYEKRYAYSLGTDIMIWSLVHISTFGEIHDFEHNTSDISISLQALEIESAELLNYVSIDDSAYNSIDEYTKDITKRVEQFSNLVRMMLSKRKLPNPQTNTNQCPKSNETENGKIFISMGNSGQVIIPSDESKVNVTQKNNFSTTELKIVLDNVKNVIPNGLSIEEKETVEASLEVVQTELAQKCPRKSFVNTALTALRTIKGTTEFAAAVAALVQFVQTLF